MASLFEAYRPQSLEDVVGQSAAVKQIRTVLAARGWGGQAWWLTGPSGSGKTTLARIIARIGADPIAIEELDSRRLTPAKVGEIVDSYVCRCLFGKGGKCFIVNEAHGLRKDTIQELLTALEPDGGLPDHIVWCFTTTKAGETKLFADDEAGDAGPLLSRCKPIELVYNTEAARAFARRAQYIAQKEGIDGLPVSVYESAVTASQGNFRRVLQAIESGSFRADAVANLEREYGFVKSTKGPAAEARRAELTAAIQSAKGGA